MMKRFSPLLLICTVVSAATNGNTSLPDAIQRGDLAAVAAIIQQGGDVNRASPDGTTALMLAAHFDNLPMALLLLHAGARVGAVNAYGVSALTEAAASGDPKLLASLLNASDTAGRSAGTSTAQGEPILMTAVRAGNPAAVRLLLDHGAAVNNQESWKRQTALMWAAAANHAEIAKLLIDRGAQLDGRSSLVTPEKKHPANGNLVSEQPKGGLTALLFAAREGSSAVAAILAHAGAKLNLADPDGITPLTMAIINGHYDTAAILIGAGADVNAADTWGRTALYAAIDMHTLEPSTTRPAPRDADKLDGLAVAKLLLDHGALPDPRLVKAVPGRGIPDGPDPLLQGGATPFLRAAKTGDVAAMKLLLDRGADPMLMTEHKVNALMAASGQGWKYGDSQISEADALQAVKFCIELRFDVNAVNDKKETALHGAADRGADSIVQYLLDHGADPKAKDLAGHTALEVAAGGEVRGHPGSPSTMALLKKLTEAHR